jgi:UDPglucose 6-dehydrogenase
MVAGMSRISVLGLGYVGLVTAACLADLGHEVTGVDIDAEKITRLRRGEPTIYEPGLPEIMARVIGAGRLRFASEYSDAVKDSEFVFITVATPIGRRGDVSLKFVRQAARNLAQELRQPITIVNKSTVPVGTGDVISRIVRENLSREIPFNVVSNPEFLREGSAIGNFMKPDRLVFGSRVRAAAEAVAALYANLYAPILITDVTTAELIKYASNAFLAMRISFINEIARICERVEADVKGVAEGMGLDRRIGPHFLEAGVGYGSSCFPNALARMAESMGYHPELLDAVAQINVDQRRYIVEKVREVLGGLTDQTIGLLGLSYKANTDDIREAPSLEIIENLLLKGAHVRAYDPAAMPSARRLSNAVEYCPDPYALAAGADALLVVTEWDEFRSLDFRRIKDVMRRPVVVDGRNIYDPRTMRELGFIYRGVGRS